MFRTGNTPCVVRLVQMHCCSHFFSSATPLQLFVSFMPNFYFVINISVAEEDNPIPSMTIYHRMSTIFLVAGIILATAEKAGSIFEVTDDSYSSLDGKNTVNLKVLKNKQTGAKASIITNFGVVSTNLCFIQSLRNDCIPHYGHMNAMPRRLLQIQPGMDGNCYHMPIGWGGHI